MMRLKGYDWNYNYDSHDDFVWMLTEDIARRHGSGNEIHGLGVKLVEAQQNVYSRLTRKNDFKIGQWAYLNVDFGLQICFGPVCTTVWSTDKHYIFK